MADLPASRDAAAIAGAVVDLARHIGLRMVAENVETEQVAAAVEKLGAGALQDHPTGLPKPAADLAARHAA